MESKTLLTNAELLSLVCILHIFNNLNLRNLFDIDIIVLEIKWRRM